MKSPRAVLWGWYAYDWANSAFYTTAVTVLLGPYLTETAKSAAGPDGFVHPLGIPVDPRSWWSYLISISVILQVVLLPVAGALADATRRKKRLLALFAWAGAAATMALYFVEGGGYLEGGLLFLIANLTFGASIVVYNSFLPQIAAPEERDAVSSKGWGIGYLGGGLLLGLNLLLVQNAGVLGLTAAHSVRVSLFSAGAWWGVFTVVPAICLRDYPPVRVAKRGERVLASGFRQLFNTLRHLRRYRQTLTFLAAYMLYNDAIQAVIALAGQYGADEIGMPVASLILAILMVQFAGFFGAMLFNLAARLAGSKNALLVSLIIWAGVLVAMYGPVRTERGYFMAAAVVAIVLGGSQALSRSLFSQMIPRGKEAEYFSLYEVSDKGTSWLAPLVFGLTRQFTGDYRAAILSLIAFFALGFLVLWRVDVRRAAAEAGENASDTFLR